MKTARLIVDCEVLFYRGRKAENGLVGPRSRCLLLKPESATGMSSEPGDSSAHPTTLFLFAEKTAKT
jgi:hypothetical protein